MDYRESINKNIFHDSDHALCKARLDSFYGMVCHKQNMEILHKIKNSHKVLDVGAGYGNLTDLLNRNGFSAVGIEPNEIKRKLAEEWYGVKLLNEDIYKTSFKDNEFDCIILREVVFHLDFAKAFQELNRIAKKQIIIFQGNSVITRRIGQKIFGHTEFNERHKNYYVDFFKKTQFSNVTITYRDIIAFPLSGGFIGKQLVPSSMKSLMRFIITVDKLFNSFLEIFRLQNFFCMRFIISAEVDEIKQK